MKTLFSKHGKVAGAKIVTNAKSPGAKCYGFVMMASTEEASKCIQHLHRTELHGRMISVERAKGDPSSQSQMTEKKQPAGVDVATRGTLAAKRNPALSKITTETPKVGTAAAAVHSKPPTSTSGKNLVKKTTEKKEDVKRTPAKKDAPAKTTSTRADASRKLLGHSGAANKDASKADEVASKMKQLEERLKERDRKFRNEWLERQRASERRRFQGLERERVHLRGVARQQADEQIKLEREKERLRLDKQKLELERLEAERERILLERERERMEFEREEQRRSFALLKRQEMQQMRGIKRPHDPAPSGWPAEAKRPAMSSNYPPSATSRGGVAPGRYMDRHGDRRSDEHPAPRSSAAVRSGDRRSDGGGVSSIKHAGRPSDRVRRDRLSPPTSHHASTSSSQAEWKPPPTGDRSRSGQSKDEKGMSGYSSSQAPSMVVHDHGWHSAGHSSKQHSYGPSAPSGGQWSSRGSAAVSARSDWSGRSGTSSSAAGGGSSFASSAKNVMGMVTEATHGAASSRAPVEARYDAYKSMTNSATRRY